LVTEPHDGRAGHEPIRDPLAPGIFLELLDAKRHALLLLIDGEDDRADDVALLHDLARVSDLLRPGHVGDVQEPVDALLDLDEGAVVRQVPDLALDDRAGGVLLLDEQPRVHLGLLHAEADLALLLVDVEHHHLDAVADADDLARVADPLRPGHLADVDEPLEAVLDLHEGAVGHHVDDLAGHARADRVLELHVVPRAREQLLEAEGDALALAVDLQDLDLDLLVDLDHLGRVADATPGHVGDMKEAVDAAEVHERAEVGDVLDRALAGLAFLDLLHQLALQALALLLDQLAARDDDVHPGLVDLDDLGLDLLAR
jgi:hypothetical protein